MATFHLRRFSNVAALKEISPESLLELLEPHKDFFAGRDVELPDEATEDNLNYEGIVKVFMTPDAGTPPPLLEALYRIHEMATEEGADELLEELEDRGVTFGDRPTPADLAVKAWLFNKDLLEKKHAEQFLIRPRSFEYFQTDRSSVPAFRRPSERILQAMAEDMDDWFEKKKRGRGSKVFIFDKDGAIWFLVRHGELYKREGSLNEGQSGSVFYRPEKHDVVVYDPLLGELRMNAASKGEKELYREMFGKHIFGDEDFFPGSDKYTLEPLKRDGADSMVCADVEGMDWIKLKELRYFWGGPQREMEIRKADDIFAALEAREKQIPRGARIIRASFLVKFTDSKVPRTISVRPSNIAEYTRDDDGAVVEDFLTKRGFIIGQDEPEEESEYREEVGAALAGV